MPPTDHSDLVSTFLAVRKRTETLAAPLTQEDQLLQAMPEASPVKWHRAHTTWSLDTFVLEAPSRPAWSIVFNSYYEGVGARHARPDRALLSRPSFDEVGAWRAEADAAVADRILNAQPDQLAVPGWQAGSCQSRAQHPGTSLQSIQGSSTLQGPSSRGQVHSPGRSE